MTEQPSPDPASAVEPGEAPTDPDAELAARLRGFTGPLTGWSLLQILFLVGVANPVRTWVEEAGLGFWAATAVSLVLIGVGGLFWWRFLTRPAPPSSGLTRYAPYMLKRPAPFAWIALVHLFVSAAWVGLGQRFEVPWGWGMAATLALSALALLVSRWVYRTPPDPSRAR